MSSLTSYYGTFSKNFIKKILMYLLIVKNDLKFKAAKKDDVAGRLTSLRNENLEQYGFNSGKCISKPLNCTIMCQKQFKHFCLNVIYFWGIANVFWTSNNPRENRMLVNILSKKLVTSSDVRCFLLFEQRDHGKK